MHVSAAPASPAQDPDQPPLLVHSYEDAAAGGGPAYFGELALMYRRPRAATVIARTNGVLWSLHRNDFKASTCVRSLWGTCDVVAALERLRGDTWARARTCVRACVYLNACTRALVSGAPAAC